jgi:hypothetical protein
VESKVRRAWLSSMGLTMSNDDATYLGIDPGMVGLSGVASGHEGVEVTPRRLDAPGSTLARAATSSR